MFRTRRRDAVTGRSRSIGLVLSRPELISVDGFLPVMIYGLNEVCRERGYRLLMEAVHDPPGADDYLDLVKSKRIDSMIIINPRKGDSALRKVIESKFPVLVWGSSERPQESAIATKEGQASRQVTESHFDIARTSTQIAYIGHACRLNTQLRSIGDSEGLSSRRAVAAVKPSVR